MSTYRQMTPHPDGGERMATWIDDHFGNHRYGVQFDGEERVYEPSELPREEPKEGPAS